MISYGEPSNPKFKYTKRPQSSKVLLHFKRDDDIKLENPSTLNKREWNKKFNLTKLRTFWTQKGKVSFDITDRKFPSTLLPKEVQDEIAKKNKPLFRKDYLPQSEQQFHNKLFNINHGIAIDDYVPPNESINFSKKVFEPFSLRSPRWNRNCILDKMEKKELEMKTKEESEQNSKNFWKNCKTKPYCSPEKNFKKTEKLMKKIQECTKEEREIIYQKVLNENKGKALSQEKINYLVYKEIKKVYQTKIEELQNKKLNTKKKKIKNLDDIEISNKLFLLKSQQNQFTSEYLKPLINKQEIIQKEEEKIKNNFEKEKERQEKEKKIKEKNERINTPQITNTYYVIPESKYPVNKNIIEREKKDVFFNHQTIEKENSNAQPKEIFLKAYNTVTQEYLKKEKEKKKIYQNKYNEKYRHTGAYRIFTENEKEYYAWSCCMKESRYARGCVKKLDKKFKWNFE